LLAQFRRHDGFRVQSVLSDIREESRRFGMREPERKAAVKRH
jgi:hypothetical protein